ncbi:MAG: protein kinase [Polyangiaceae bacterium]
MLASLSGVKAGTNIAGKYLLEAPLASGGMGSVWRARHVDLDVEVAVKLIASELVSNEHALARFKREARAAAQLRSPHVVQILDYGVWEGTPYIAMELLSGHDLDKELEQHTRLSLPRVKAIAAQVGKALRVAHDAGIVHRDLKPANIYLAQQGGEEIVKLLDFGIAKESRTPGKITGGSTLLGSPLYMSPEQVAGDPVDAQTDLWSFAVVLYEALVGSPPFSAQGIGTLFSAIAHEPAPSPSVRGLFVAGLDGVMERALEKDPGKRYGSAKELVDAIVALPDDTYRFTMSAQEAPGTGTRSVVTSPRAVEPDAQTVSAVDLRAEPSPRGRESNTLDLATSTRLRPESASSVPVRRGRGWILPAALTASAGALVALFLWMRSAGPPSSVSATPAASLAGSEIVASPADTVPISTPSTPPIVTAPPGASSAVPSSSPPATSVAIRAEPVRRPAGTPLGSTPQLPKAPTTKPVDTTFGIPHGR